MAMLHIDVREFTLKLRVVAIGKIDYYRPTISIHGGEQISFAFSLVEIYPPYEPVNIVVSTSNIFI